MTLRGKVPDEVIEREVGAKAEQFEHYRLLAQQKIPTVNLGNLFPTEIEKGRILLENFLGKTGNITIEEVCKICLIVVWLKPHGVFEFGTYNGMTTLQIATNAPENCRVHTLDIPPNEVSESQVGEYDSCLAEKAGAFQFEVGHYFKGTSFQDRISQVWGDSINIDLTSYYDQIDLVFVDAAHTYPYVKSDTKNALRMIRPGGVVLWHDYLHVLHSDVTKCLYEYAQNGLPVYHLRGTNLAVYYAEL
jgi:hypothetical protein